MAAEDDFATAVAAAPEAPAAEEPAADAPVAQTEPVTLTPEQENVELRAKLAAAEKSAGDYKSQAVGRQNAADREEAINSRFDAIEGQNVRNLVEMMEAINSGRDYSDPRIEEAIERLKTEAADTDAKQKATGQWATVHSEYLTELNEILSDGKGGNVLDPAGPELEQVRGVWSAANAAQDKVGMERTLRLATAAITKAKATGAVPEKPDNRSALEMATAASGGGAAPESHEAIWKAYGRGELNMNAKVREAGEALGYL